MNTFLPSSLKSCDTESPTYCVNDKNTVANYLLATTKWLFFTLSSDQIDRLTSNPDSSSILSAIGSPESPLRFKHKRH